MINVFIIGSKGLPARYGGFETFIDFLTKEKVNTNIHYFVSCMGGTGVEVINGATCFHIPFKIGGPFGRTINVWDAIRWTRSHIKRDYPHDGNIIYILGCRIGPFLKKAKKSLQKAGAIVVCNPDGLEWKRGKWNRAEKSIVLFFEKQFVNASDFVVCDSINIQKYIFTAYPKFSQKNSAFIPYGAELTPSTCSAEVFQKWLDKTGTSCRAFYLVVGRFVPENNFEVVIREFMQSATKKDLIIITNVEKNKFYKYLQKKLGFEKDGRIKFVGTVYDQNLLAKIRENAFAYIHGHSVGGTNPSLLEALGHTELNLLFDVPFNREVAGAEALYFSDRSGDLTNLIKNVEAKPFVLNPKSVIATRYSWAFVISSYEALFVSFFQAPAVNIGI